MNKNNISWDKFDECIGLLIYDLKSSYDINSNNTHIVTLYRGGLPLGVSLSNKLKVPLSILDYQRLDGVDKESQEVSFIKNANIKEDCTILLVDDIADEGITIRKSIEFLNEHFPKNKIIVYTLIGNKKHNKDWKYSIENNGNWQVFPWE